MEEGRQRELEAAGAEGKKRLEGKRFFITLLSGHDITLWRKEGSYAEGRRQKGILVQGQKFFL
ncbi:MAG: hypothetical protein F6K17_29475 [Okeania sp. SIO3C4]|nr:hypothetical protein [Okeania sp. SIO3C4]